MFRFRRSRPFTEGWWIGCALAVRWAVWDCTVWICVSRTMGLRVVSRSERGVLGKKLYEGANGGRCPEGPVGRAGHLRSERVRIDFFPTFGTGGLFRGIYLSCMPVSGCLLLWTVDRQPCSPNGTLRGLSGQTPYYLRRMSVRVGVFLGGEGGEQGVLTGVLS